VATIKEVARYAGVAPSTVSRVLNGRPFVTDEVRHRVENAVAMLGYRPSSVARSLRMRSTQLLGMVVRDMSNSNFAVICEAAEAAAQERGYSLLVCNSNRSSSKEARYLELLIQRQVDGVLVFVADERVNNLKPWLEQGIPVVLVDSELPVPIDQIRSDGEHGGYVAARHLLELGHRRIAVLVYSQELVVGRSRLRGCLRAFAEFRVAPDPALVRYCHSSPESAEAEALHVLRVEKPTALLATSLQLTTGLLRAVGQLGLKVPADLSIVGFDETELTRQYQPTLTVVARDVPAMGAQAVSLLLDRMEQAEVAPPRLVTIPFALRPGGSTSAPMA
jgi:LacI family transcriptional regulator